MRGGRFVLSFRVGGERYGSDDLWGFGEDEDDVEDILVVTWGPRMLCCCLQRTENMEGFGLWAFFV